MSDLAVAIRDEKGMFLPGKSGNVRGRPPTKRERIQLIQEKLQLAVQRRMDPRDVSEVVRVMVDAAKNGDVKAAKLIMEYALEKPNSTQERSVDKSNSIKIVIENATLYNKMQQEPKPIDVEVKVITHG